MSNSNPAKELYTLWWKEAEARGMTALCKVESLNENLIAKSIAEFRSYAYEWLPPLCRDALGRIAPDNRPEARPRTWLEEQGTYVLCDEQGESVLEYKVTVADGGVRVFSHDRGEEAA